MTISLVFGTVGELRQILNRQDLDDRAPITLSVTGYVGDDNPNSDHGYDEFRVPCKTVTIINRPGNVHPVVVRLS